LAQGLQSAQQTTWNFPLSFGLATIDDIRPLFFATGPACSGPEDRERLLLHVKAARGRYCFRERGKCPIVDEPFGALDYVTKRQLHDVLLKLWAQSDGKNRRTVLFVTHDVDEALTLADRILVLHSGRLVDDLGISVLRPRTADSLLLAGDDASKARVSRPPWPRRRNGARGSHGRLGAGMIKSFTHAVHRAPTSLLVLAGMAGFWQVLSMIFRPEALPGEPMVPGWQVLATKTFLSLSDYWQGGLGVESVASGGRPCYLASFLAVVSNSLDTVIRLYTGLFLGAVIGTLLGLAVSWSGWTRRIVRGGVQSTSFISRRTDKFRTTVAFCQ
jgi:hypothetical protein